MSMHPINACFSDWKEGHIKGGFNINNRLVTITVGSYKVQYPVISLNWFTESRMANEELVRINDQMQCRENVYRIVELKDSPVKCIEMVLTDGKSFVFDSEFLVDVSKEVWTEQTDNNNNRQIGCMDVQGQYHVLFEFLKKRMYSKDKAPSGYSYRFNNGNEYDFRRININPPENGVHSLSTGVRILSLIEDQQHNHNVGIIESMKLMNGKK